MKTKKQYNVLAVIKRILVHMWEQDRGLYGVGRSIKIQGNPAMQLITRNNITVRPRKIQAVA